MYILVQEAPMIKRLNARINVHTYEPDTPKTICSLQINCVTTSNNQKRDVKVVALVSRF